MAPHQDTNHIISSSPTKHVAAIFGVTGLVGKELAIRLTSMTESWKIYGIARKPEKSPSHNTSYSFISCDLLDPLDTQKKLSSLQGITHIFWITWASQFPLDSQECCQQNKAMLSNALNAILPRAKGLKHFSLQTGMKHYISLQGPLDFKDIHYYDEDHPRASGGRSFYYVLEDLLKERLGGKVSWSVQRPGLITGCSSRTLYNFMGSLCVYGSICKYLNLPFIFGGTRECWEETWIDISDARLVADQHIWASTNENTQSTCGQAFNAINGSSFTWKAIWPAIGRKFGLQVPDNMFSEYYLYSDVMADKDRVWKDIVKKKGLVDNEMEDMANWTFLDMLFQCPFKLLGTREKVERLGFRKRYTAFESISYWIDFMRDEKLIP